MIKALAKKSRVNLPDVNAFRIPYLTGYPFESYMEAKHCGAVSNSVGRFRSV